MYEAHFKEIANRIDRAFDNFAAIVKEVAEVTQDEAEIITTFYIKNKLVKRDTWAGKYTVKHGAYWDKDVLLRGLEMANA